MFVYFIGGSLGAALVAAAVGWFGWSITTAVTAGAVTLAMVITFAARPTIRSSEFGLETDSG